MNPKAVSIRVEPVRATTVDHFYQVHCAENCSGWCFCSAWWVPTWEGWSERSAAANRAVRDKLFEQGIFDGLILYEDNRPVGWAQVGPRDRLVKLVRQFSMSPDPETWAVTCFFIAPEYRGRGLAGLLLEGVIQYVKDAGVSNLEAYPKRGENLDALDLWTGPEGLIKGAGFTLIRDDDSRPVYRLDL